MTEWHTELVECPKCAYVQAGVVDHTYPDWTYSKECEQCGHAMSNSNWNPIPVGSEPPGWDCQP